MLKTRATTSRAKMSTRGITKIKKLFMGSLDRIKFENTHQPISGKDNSNNRGNQQNTTASSFNKKEICIVLRMSVENMGSSILQRSLDHQKPPIGSKGWIFHHQKPSDIQVQVWQVGLWWWGHWWILKNIWRKVQGTSEVPIKLAWQLPKFKWNNICHSSYSICHSLA